MSESIVRKIQPFTIGTKLSVPSVAKCPDFPEGYLPSQALDNCKLRHNLNDHVSLFLGRAQVRSGNSRLVPQSTSLSTSSSSSITSQLTTTTTTTTATTTTTTQVIPAKQQQQNMAEEDHLNRNAICLASAASRSIRKITISSSTDSSAPRPDQGLGIPRVRVNPQVENNNNNNNITTTTSNPQLPRIVGVSCENKPSSHFKVLLRKDSDEDRQNNSVQETGKYQSVQQTPVIKALSPKRDLPKGESPLSENKDTTQCSGTAIQNDHCFTQRNALFNKEISQAEAWIKGKLRDLKDGCNIQKSSLTDWEEVSQTLQRDLKDFENTLIQLNQMGEQLMCKTNPNSDLVKKQLTQVRELWQTLKQTAANQTKALGGARNLYEFNRKVERLEAWIKEKQEEEQSLANLLGENIDKMQLTRRILDLKQDEQLYRNLHEEINHLALKLEKQSKAEGRSISSRRKHINKMWLKVQSLLKDYHENLQLVLEVSSSYQQADNIMCAINNMRRSISASHGKASSGDGEIRDIASQIMMLDVTVSQLSNLHPSLAARVTQKQAEVKDCWALLQKTVRSEKPAPSSSHFAREDGDPATASREPQCSVGTSAHRLMGKEVKEEQNRLKGCVGGRDTATTRVLTGCSLDESGQNDGVSEVIPRLQTEAERKSRSEEKQVAVAAAGTGTGGDHPQLHTQLQKFTVSADKTLSWLKDNVAMATQICYTVGSNSSFEAAKRCQAVLEQDILCNRARIELVKKEGRSLVRAQHPGSAKIEEFLGQLEVLWEELKKQHQRNVVVLQASEELNFRAVRVLQALGGLETWLEAVETSIRESSVAGDPESMSLAEHESCLLEREVSARGLQLQALRREVDTLRTQRHLHTELLPARIQEVERKYQSVQSALTQQSSVLQDTRMLTEFLERVELEEGNYSTLGEPLHGEISSEPSLLALPAGGGNVPLLESIGNPVEELREAVEMLNDTARERGRSVCQDQAIQELLSRHATVSVQVKQGKQQASELTQDVQARESEMAVRCEPERSGLEALQEQQQQLQAECAELKEEVEAMEGLTARLEELCPERLHVLGAEVQATLGAWRELERHMEENQGRLRHFGQLRDFFRNYLAMISWTEDTRSYIFSESAKHQAKNNSVPVAEMLDLQIEQKFKEFDELSGAAKKLIDSEHHLTKMIKERMEELRSMLGWILVHWRAQKAHWKKRRRRSETKVDEDAIYTEATVCSSTPQVTSPLPDAEVSTSGGLVPQAKPSTAESLTTGPSRGLEEQTPEGQDAESGYEVMNSVSHKAGSDTTDGPCAIGEKPSNPHLLVLKEPGSPPQRGTVNLILSFNNTGDSQLQVQEPENEQVDRVSEPIHRVSTFLHVKDNSTAGPVYESMSLPRLSSNRAQASAFSSCRSPHSSSTTSASTSPTSGLALNTPSDGHAPQVSSVSFHTLPRGTSNTTTTATHSSSISSSSAMASASIFSSLKRRSKRRKKKRDARRHTIQRIMGVEQQEDGEEEPSEQRWQQQQQQEPAEREQIIYDTHTWPLKERRKRRNAGKSTVVAAPEMPVLMDYVKNPLLSDIDAECAGELRSVQPISQGQDSTSRPPGPGNRVKGHCRFFSLGSVLSFELPKDVGLIPCIPDVITIAPPESRRRDPKNPELNSDRSMALSTFKLARSPPVRKEADPEPSPQAEATIQIQHEENQEAHQEDFPPPPSPVAEDLSQAPSQSKPTSVQLRRLSGVSGLHEQAGLAWDELANSESRLHTTSDPSAARLRENGLHSQLSLGRNRTSSATEATATSAVTTETSHVCPSVNTLIRDLSGHKYHGSSNLSGKESPVAVAQSHTSHMVLSFKASSSSNGSSNGISGSSGREDSVDSGHSSSGSFKFCVEAPGPETPDDSPPRRAIGRVRSLESGDRSKAGVTPVMTTSVEDPVHPDHQQFEEEEEELEDIWNQTNGYRRSVCSDIMYQGYQEEPSSSPPCQQRSPSPKEQAVIYRKLVTASAPNLLVAEFRLPPSIQNLLGYGKNQNPKAEAPALGKRDRRSWAAFSHQDQSSKQATLVFNETASHPVRFPEMGDHHKYIYQYKEEEEEEEDVERQKGEEGEEVDVDTGCPKDLLSIHMGLDGPSGQAQHCTEDQGYMTITGGRCGASNGQKPEFPSMEGTLERKHRLLPGGKKAPCRTWNTYHAILYRQTLSFYIDRKDTLRSSASSLPLNLAGAECVPVPEYAKKPNCFSLRLRDGSEYLLSASSRFMMKKWMLRIHANTGSEDAVPSLPMFPSSSIQEDSVNMNHIPSSICYCSGKCHCPARDDAKSCLQIGTGHPKEIVLLSGDGSHLPLWNQGKAVDVSLSSPATRAGRSEDDFNPLSMASLSTRSAFSHSQDWLSGSSKRRSHSFTSATYQRIKPVRLPPSGGSQDSSSNYSVTLLIGDQPSICNTTERPLRAVYGSGLERPLDFPLRNYASLPRPRNKSVFKKFFSKKE